MTQLGENITYAGLTPTAEESQQIRNMTTAIEQFAPSDASLQVHICKERGFINGTVKVLSCAGQFTGEASAHSIEDLVPKLMLSISAELSKWKKERFIVSAG